MNLFEIIKNAPETSQLITDSIVITHSKLQQYNKILCSVRVMSKLNVDQKTIKDLFQSKKSDFLIPDYQRPYAWGEAECRTLWDDIFSFAIPDEGKTEFDSNSEYFLYPIVTFRNEEKLEVIDGQQRLTTLMLLLRAFYSKFGHMQDKASVSTKQNIEKCLRCLEEKQARESVPDRYKV